MSQFLSLLLCWSAAAPVLQAEPSPWEQVYDRPSMVAALDEPAVCLLDIQHPENLRRELSGKPLDQFSRRRLQRRIAELSGLRCLLVHFSELEGRDLESPQIKAILITGRSREMSRGQDEKFYGLIRQTQIPMFGFCGGMQMIGEAFGSEVVGIRALRAGEQDPNPSYHPGRFKEWGYLPVQVVAPDPLFKDLPTELLVRQAHAYHVREVPPQFQLLASTAECPVQAIRYRDRLLYGTQFHPEAYDDQHPHGRTILENFFRAAGILR